MPLTLSEKEKLFPKLLVLLLQRTGELGYEVTLGEAYRPPEVAATYSAQGRGIKHSLHSLRIAIDLNFYKDGAWISDGSKLVDIGAYWESLSTADYQCCWGGRFNDGNHFSLKHEGVR